MPELTITSPYVHSSADSKNTFTMGLGNPMSESTLTLCQSRLYPKVRDFVFGLCCKIHSAGLGVSVIADEWKFLSVKNNHDTWFIASMTPLGFEYVDPQVSINTMLGGVEMYILWTILCRSFTLCFWPDSEPTKFLHHPRQKWPVKTTLREWCP